MQYEWETENKTYSGRAGRPFIKSGLFGDTDFKEYHILKTDAGRAWNHVPLVIDGKKENLFYSHFLLACNPACFGSGMAGLIPGCERPTPRTKDTKTRRCVSAKWCAADGSHGGESVDDIGREQGDMLYFRMRPASQL